MAIEDEDRFGNYNVEARKRKYKQIQTMSCTTTHTEDKYRWLEEEGRRTLPTFYLADEKNTVSVSPS